MTQIVLQRADDGTISVVGTFPQEIQISRELLTDCDPCLLRRRFRMLDFRLANGRAVYRLDGKGECYYWARRQYVEPVELAG